MKKTMLVLVMLASLLVSVDITSAQTVKPIKHRETSCTILPAYYYFPEGQFGEFFICKGTFMSDKIPYDPRNPNMSYIKCSKHEMNCRISTAYISKNLLDLITNNYKVEKWTPELITARSTVDHISDKSTTLVIRLSDKSATISHLNAKTGESYKEFLKDASYLTKDKTLQEYYFGNEVTK